MLLKIIILVSLLFINPSNGNAQLSANLKQARKDVAKLTSAKMAGRGYIKNGHTKAAKYIAKRWEKIGVKPSSQNNNDYFQYFDFTCNTITTAQLSINGTKLVHGMEYIVHEESGAGSGNVKSYYLGYGIDKEEYSKANGKVVVVYQGLPDSISSIPERKKVYQEIAKTATKIALAKSAGAKAIILLTTKLTASLDQQSLDFPIFQIQTNATILPSLLTKETDIKFQIETKTQPVHSQNVIGYIPATTTTDSVIIISAHYDHLGKQGKIYFPGANDNGSGIATLLHFADYFHAHPLQKYNVVLIAFGAEEIGLLGSDFYANKQPIYPLEKTKFILNIDLMGAGEEGITLVGGRELPNYVAQMETINKDIQAVPTIKTRNNAPNSDHYYFLKKGVKGFFIYTMGGPKHYHDVEDTADHLLFSNFDKLSLLLTKFIEGI